MNNDNRPNQSATVKPAFFYGYTVAIAAFCIIFAAFGIRFSYGVFFTPMSTELGWNSATTALAFSISAIVEGIFNFILGGMTDKYGPRIILTASGIVLGLGYCLMPLVHFTWQFFLFYSLVVGIGMGGIFVPLISIVTRWFRVRRTLINGLVISGTSLGLVVVAPLSTLLIASFDWRKAFLILGIAIAAITVIAAQFLKRDPSVMGLLPDGVSSRADQAEPATLTGITFRESLRSYQLWVVFLIYFVIGFYFLGNQIFLVPDAIHSGINSTTAAYILSTHGAVTIVALILFGAVGDKVGNKRVSIVSCVLCLIASATIVTNDIRALYFVFAVVAGLGRGGLTCSMSPLVASLFGIRSHGMIFGFCGFGNTIGQALGPYIMGRVLDYNHNYNIALSVCGLVILLGLILVLVLKPVKKIL